MNLRGEIKWVMADHACRVCFGRVLMRKAFGRKGFTFRCASCGAEGHGDAPGVVCACGLTLEGTKDMGVRCQINAERGPESIDEVVAAVQGSVA